MAKHIFVKRIADPVDRWKAALEYYDMESIAEFLDREDIADFFAIRSGHAYCNDTVMTAVAWRGQPDLMAKLLDLGGPIDVPNNQGYTPLITACNRKHAEMAKLLIEHSDLEARDGAGYTALIRAASKGDAEIVGALLSAGADPNAVCDSGASALMNAAFMGFHESVSRLLAHGADMDYRSPEGDGALSGLTALEIGMASSHLETRKIFLAYQERAKLGELVHRDRDAADPDETTSMGL